jgi:hypothetical protein
LSLVIAYQAPFNLSNIVGQATPFSTNGVTAEFVLDQPIGEVAGTVEVSATQYLAREGGFIKDTVDNSIILDSIPAPDQQGIAPSAIGLNFNVYDQSVVEGVTDPRVDETQFFLYVTDPQAFDYIGRSGQPGIGIAFVDNITSAGADLTWVQLACAENNVALTYAATGATLYTRDFTAWTEVASGGIWAGASTVVVDNATEFVLGDYVVFNIGTLTEEEIQIQSSTSTTLTFYTTLNYAHASGETIYTRARPFYAKATCPVNATGGEAALLIDLTLNITASKRQKV